MSKELCQILQHDHEEQFVKEWFCFLFIDEQKAHKNKKTNDKMEDVQRQRKASKIARRKREEEQQQEYYES